MDLVEQAALGLFLQGKTPQDAWRDAQSFADARDTQATKPLVRYVARTSQGDYVSDCFGDARHKFLTTDAKANAWHWYDHASAMSWTREHPFHSFTIEEAGA